MAIPLIMTHGPGGESYLYYTLKQARQYNERVTLLGEPEHQHLTGDLGVEHYNWADFYTEARQFFDEEYVQYSHYKEGYDRHVMAIFFFLKEFMQIMDLEVIASVDSDMMVYCDMTQEEARLPKDYLVACCIPEYQPEYRWNASTETCFFTYEGACEMCNFMHQTYTTPEGLARLREKWDWHIANNRPGGVCDLTLLYLFVESRDRDRIVNLTPVITTAEHGTFSHKISGDENSIQGEYRMDGRLKEIQWRDGIPYGYNLRLRSWVRFKDIHLQGGDKVLAPSFYRDAV